MKKVCIISMTNLYLCPYIEKYISIIEGKCTYDVIYWNRHEVEENMNANSTYAYEKPLKEGQSKIIKFIRFVQYRIYVKKILQQNKYDSIIILHNYIAILLPFYLRKDFKGRYILDIRDLSFENNRLFYSIEKIAIYNSAKCVISSKGFKAFLPPGDYLLTHNSPNVKIEDVEKYRTRERNEKEPINISFIGLIRFYEQNKKIIKKFGNDDRFTLGFYGQNAFQLELIAGRDRYKNITYYDRFEPEKTTELYLSTDIINNAYGNCQLSLDYALSNKLYYAIKFGIPILVSPGTYMEEVVQEYGIGFTLDTENDYIVDKLYNYYNNIDWKSFYKNCDILNKVVTKDEQQFEEEITRVIFDKKES